MILFNFAARAALQSGVLGVVRPVPNQYMADGSQPCPANIFKPRSIHLLVQVLHSIEQLLLSEIHRNAPLCFCWFCLINTFYGKQASAVWAQLHAAANSGHGECSFCELLWLTLHVFLPWLQFLPAPSSQTGDGFKIFKFSTCRQGQHTFDCLNHPADPADQGCPI